MNHTIMKKKLHHNNVRGWLWTMIDDLYVGGEEMVRWRGGLSRTYTVSQGVRQGGILSTCLYLGYINDLLTDYEKAGVGVMIGDVNLSAPTCADDCMPLSNMSPEMQAMLGTAYSYSQEHRYSIHPGKSSVTEMINKHLTLNKDKKVWRLGEDTLNSSPLST